MTHDVIVIGGSYAGMAASLQLLRARRSVLVIDAGLRRNRFASHAHGFLGQDGVDPAVIAQQARHQLEAYPTLTWVDGSAVSVTGAYDAFAVTLADGAVHHGRRVLFATGVTDLLPDVPGVAERWGRSVFHCPYCHGYELDQGDIGVIATGPMSVHQGQLLQEWGRVTFLTNGTVTLEPEEQEAFAREGVTVETSPIAQVEGAADVRLGDGRVLPFAGLFLAPVATPASEIPAGMGCEIVDGPMGRTIATNEARQTNLAGVYACGDVKMPQSVAIAVGDGTMAGVHLHRSLVFPDVI